ncbi:MAG: fimbria/pilus outer membrane usher protein [Methylococcales bacterium]
MLQTLTVAMAGDAQGGMLPATAAHSSGAFNDLFLAVRLNGDDLHETALFLNDGQGRLLVTVDEIKRWRLRLPGAPVVHHQGKDFHGLDGIEGLSYRIDQSTQSISIDAAPDLFAVTTVRGLAPTPTPIPSSLGGFMNYDILAEYAGGGARLNALAELGAFNAWGVGTANVLGRDLSGSARLIRIDSTWTRDLPAQRSSLRLMDAISRPAEWGASVRFGGIQWATNFATQPRFVSFPLPTLSGESALPSTADLYVNNALRLRREVPAGPFSITDVPVSTGLGEARLIVKDLLGREQIINRPFYVSPRLLSTGLDDYSYEMGLVRNNFGTESFDYGRFFAAGTHRRGFSDRFTGEIHAEVLKRQGTIGANALYLLPDLGVFGISVAGSHNHSSAGGLAGLSFERQARWLSILGRTQVATSHFTLLGLEPGKPAPRQISQASVSISASDNGSVSFGYIHQDYRDRPDVKLVTAGYNRRVGSLGYFNFAFTGSLRGAFDPAFSLTFTVPIGERSSLSLNGTLQPDFQEATVQLQQNLPRGTGYGYRVLASTGTRERLEAGLSAQNDTGLYSVDASRYGNRTAFRGSISGGLAVMAGRAFFARRLDNSFALVQVPDFPNVRIYADNQLAGRTDSNGDALIPRLRAYDQNPIRIEQADLPLDAEIESLELDAVPYFRSGYLLKFPLRRSQGARFKIILPTGQAIPAGARVQITGKREQFPVALKGEVYITGLEAHNQMRAFWQNESCEFEVEFPQSREPIPDLGTVICKGVRP